MTKEQKNVIKHQRLRVKSLGETLEEIRKTLNETSSELHQAAYGRMEQDPDEVWNLEEAAVELFHACQKLELVCGYLESATGVKK